MADAASPLAPGATEARRLYGRGFEGWDHSQGCYVTAYVTMAAGLLCSIFLWAQWKGPRGRSIGVFAQFVTFACLEGLAYGFCGVTHHILDTYWEWGVYMGRTWGASNSFWMVPWTAFLGISPVAAAFGAGVCYAFTPITDSCFKLTQLVGIVVALYEVYLCATNWFELTGMVMILWGCVSSFIGACAVAAQGNIKDRGTALAFLGMLIRVAAFALILATPASCKMVGEYRRGCWFPEEFDQNSWFHLMMAASVIALYLAALARNAQDRQASYADMLQTMTKSKDSRGCCVAMPGASG